MQGRAVIVLTSHKRQAVLILFNGLKATHAIHVAELRLICILKFGRDQSLIMQAG